MRISVRLIVSLVFAITLVSVIFALYQVHADNQSKRQELCRRSQVLAESLRDTIELLPAGNSTQRLRQIVDKFGNHELLAGVAVYKNSGEPALITATLGKRFGATPPPLDPEITRGQSAGHFFTFGTTEMFVYEVPLRTADQITGALAVFQDAAYIEAQSDKAYRPSRSGLQNNIRG